MIWIPFVALFRQTRLCVTYDSGHCYGHSTIDSTGVSISCVLITLNIPRDASDSRCTSTKTLFCINTKQNRLILTLMPLQENLT
ncbi:hypothetical protein HYC85_015876 [Camellia sinensis]|uniref:Uncharacterized protein n=1 Tax=Camellia sinensis TaxID=4442 RepID=A0A7J7H1S6_CAMSI|nr:hypothetical protein HYC85_015876 [Camellia sinensis]